MSTYSSFDPVDISILVDTKAGETFDMDTSSMLTSQYLDPNEFYNESFDGNLGLSDFEEIPDTDETSTDELDIAADDTIDAQYDSDDEGIIDLIAGFN